VEHIEYFIILALAAEIVGTLGGFGSSLFFIPIASYFLDFHSVLGITALFHVISNLVKLYFFRKGFNAKLIISIGLPAIVFVILGAYLNKFIDLEIMELFLAVFLIVLSLIFIINKNFKINPNLVNSLIGGALSGFITGLMGTGGAIRGITLAAYSLPTATFIASSAIIDLGMDLSRSFVYYSNGYIHSHDLYLVAILFVVSVLGTYIGKKILLKLSSEQFKQIVLFLILLTGLLLLLKIVFNI
jgi:uncharacterized membrane protein YfcA